MARFRRVVSDRLESPYQPPLAYGIRDYDIFYFDADTSYEAEDNAIARAKAAFAGLNLAVEVRNQARVHLWYDGKFGMPYPPLERATDGIDRFLMHNAQVGVRAAGPTMYMLRMALRTSSR